MGRRPRRGTQQRPHTHTRPGPPIHQIKTKLLEINAAVMDHIDKKKLISPGSAEYYLQKIHKLKEEDGWRNDLEIQQVTGKIHRQMKAIIEGNDVNHYPYCGDKPEEDTQISHLININNADELRSSQSTPDLTINFDSLSRSFSFIDINSVKDNNADAAFSYSKNSELIQNPLNNPDTPRTSEIKRNLRQYNRNRTQMPSTHKISVNANVDVKRDIIAFSSDDEIVVNNKLTPRKTPTRSSNSSKAENLIDYTSITMLDADFQPCSHIPKSPSILENYKDSYITNQSQSAITGKKTGQVERLEIIIEADDDIILEALNSPVIIADDWNAYNNNVKETTINMDTTPINSIVRPTNTATAPQIETPRQNILQIDEVLATQALLELNKEHYGNTNTNRVECSNLETKIQTHSIIKPIPDSIIIKNSFKPTLDVTTNVMYSDTQPKDSPNTIPNSQIECTRVKISEIKTICSNNNKNINFKPTKKSIKIKKNKISKPAKARNIKVTDYTWIKDIKFIRVIEPDEFTPDTGNFDSTVVDISDADFKY